MKFEAKTLLSFVLLTIFFTGCEQESRIFFSHIESFDEDVNKKINVFLEETQNYSGRKNSCV